MLKIGFVLLLYIIGNKDFTELFRFDKVFFSRSNCLIYFY
jgi:hypothetical protein